MLWNDPMYIILKKLTYQNREQQGKRTSTFFSLFPIFA